MHQKSPDYADDFADPMTLLARRRSDSAIFPPPSLYSRLPDHYQSPALHRGVSTPSLRDLHNDHYPIPLSPTDNSIRDDMDESSRSTHSRSPSDNAKTFAFVPLPGNSVRKRPRRRYDEIERLYECNWPDCTKAYGTLNHLNAHVTMQKHGPKRVPAEFKELRKQWRRAKKEAEAASQPSAAIPALTLPDTSFVHSSPYHHPPFSPISPVSPVNHYGLGMGVYNFPSPGPGITGGFPSSYPGTQISRRQSVTSLVSPTSTVTTDASDESAFPSISISAHSRTYSYGGGSGQGMHALPVPPTSAAAYRQYPGVRQHHVSETQVAPGFFTPPYRTSGPHHGHTLSLPTTMPGLTASGSVSSLSDFPSPAGGAHDAAASMESTPSAASAQTESAYDWGRTTSPSGVMISGTRSSLRSEPQHGHGLSSSLPAGIGSSLTSYQPQPQNLTLDTSVANASINNYASFPIRSGHPLSARARGQFDYEYDFEASSGEQQQHHSPVYSPGGSYHSHSRSPYHSPTAYQGQGQGQFPQTTPPANTAPSFASMDPSSVTNAGTYFDPNSPGQYSAHSHSSSHSHSPMMMEMEMEQPQAHGVVQNSMSTLMTPMPGYVVAPPTHPQIMEGSGSASE